MFPLPHDSPRSRIEAVEELNDSILSRPGSIPCFTFLIKGLISSGKSTLFNAILSRNMSKTSIKRQTMCQVILTESATARESINAASIYDHISEINQQVYAQVRVTLFFLCIYHVNCFYFYIQD